MKNKNILVLGAFGYSNNQLDGQTIKTRNVYNLVKDRIDGKVNKFDTIEVRKKPFLIFDLFIKLITCNTLIIIPCLNNLNITFPITYYLSKIFNYKIIHICIGGWQLEYFEGSEIFKPHQFQLKLSKKIKAFLPEMERVNDDLISKLDFYNSEVFPNFRRVENIKKIKEKSPTMKLVFMARVNKKKGYLTIFNFVEYMKNRNYNISIDFFGPIDELNRVEFLNLVDKHNTVVNYIGALHTNEIYSVLSNYDLMLFPTQYYTEGFPGSILDAYISGIPVIATNWKHAHEFVKDGETGFVVSFDNCQDEFNEKIIELYKDRNKLSEMKIMAKQESLKYSEDVAWNILSKYL